MIRSEKAVIVKNKPCAKDVYELEVSCKSNVKAQAGQFMLVHLNNSSKILGRPLGIGDINGKNVTLWYQVVGEGTKELSTYKVNDTLDVTFPLGNSFNKAMPGEKVLLIGGGMGFALFPLYVKQNPRAHIHAFLGFSTKNKVVLNEILQGIDNLSICTDDGSYGISGMVTDAIEKCVDDIMPDKIICCGPEVMYKSLKNSKIINKYPIYVSLERRMGCGVGACLVCNCKIQKKGSEQYLRACKDGPIFSLDEVVL